jgi:hypothetical protein
MEKLNNFKKDLKALLTKYNATIGFSVDDCSDTHGLTGDNLFVYFDDNENESHVLSDYWHMDKNDFNDLIEPENNNEITIKPFSQRLNFSDMKHHKSAIKINKWHNVNHYETLCKYCIDNDVNLESITDSYFDSCVIKMQEYGQQDKKIDYYYFWIDKE